MVITDYPDTELIENIRYNVTNCGIAESTQARIAVEGYLWGSDAASVLSHLSGDTKFDVIILSDTVQSASITTDKEVFNHSEHHALVKSLVLNLKRDVDARAYVFYTHHRPWLKGKDLEFFDHACKAGFTTEHLLTERVTPMFQADRGDEVERGTVYGQQVKWLHV